MSKLFILRISTLSFNYLLKIISSNLEAYKGVQKMTIIKSK